MKPSWYKINTNMLTHFAIYFSIVYITIHVTPLRFGFWFVTDFTNNMAFLCYWNCFFVVVVHKLFIFSNITVARLSPLSLLFFEEDRPIQRASTSSLSSAFIWLTTYLNLFVFFNVIAVRTIVLWQNHFEYILLDQSYIVSIHWKT